MAIVVGVVGGVITCAGIELLNFLHIDDPVGVVPVHLFCGIWSLIAAGLLTPEDDIGQGFELYGLFMGGGTRLLWVQLLAIVCIIGWCAIFSAIVLLLLSSTIGLRLSYHEELLGADLVEHNIGNRIYDKTKGRLISRPKWLKRLERQGLLKPREFSIREVENAAESVPRKKKSSGSEQNSFHRKSRVPRFKVLPYSISKFKKSRRQKRKDRPSPHHMSAFPIDAVNGKYGESFNILERNRDVLTIPQHRRGAKRVNGAPLKWQEVLDTTCDLNDIQYVNATSNWGSSYCSKYAVTTRNVGTQTDWIFLTADTEWRVLNMHEPDPEWTILNMHETEQRDTQQLKMKKRILDPHDWNSLYEHMV
ncbi:Ammonium transporter 1 member 3 [Holothuria leucospilota]|uniref:Ammonium transporter 1 member 3 n=1 Tax=Holothuria leucospilota TaxID=206669 RepID=A0A9Q1H1A9_HOLLE|nr:Ammonium transporter 1 member 3 [Holothuria leucospilota]